MKILSKFICWPWNIIPSLFYQLQWPWAQIGNPIHKLHLESILLRLNKWCRNPHCMYSNRTVRFPASLGRLSSGKCSSDSLSHHPSHCTAPSAMWQVPIFGVWLHILKYMLLVIMEIFARENQSDFKPWKEGFKRGFMHFFPHSFWNWPQLQWKNQLLHSEHSSAGKHLASGEGASRGFCLPHLIPSVWLPAPSPDSSFPLIQTIGSQWGLS